MRAQPSKRCRHKVPGRGASSPRVSDAHARTATATASPEPFPRESRRHLGTPGGSREGPVSSAGGSYATLPRGRSHGSKNKLIFCLF